MDDHRLVQNKGWSSLSHCFVFKQYLIVSEPYALKTNSLFGRVVEPIHDLLEPLGNGSLVIKPFPPSAYRQDVHSITTYCLATNSIGTLISAPQRLSAGMFFTFIYMFLTIIKTTQMCDSKDCYVI